MTKWITTIKGQHVAFTGQAWLTRPELQRLVRRLGGTPTRGAEVTTATTVLVRGRSTKWKLKGHGLKERYAAHLIREGYPLVVVSDAEFRKLVESGKRARMLDRVAGEPTEWLLSAPKKEFQAVAKLAGPLDREHSAKGRVEQSYLRRLLFGASDAAKCSLCRRELPVSLLIAGHIKARSECTRCERLDAKNIVFPVCLLGCDALYERGLVSISETGRILTTSQPGSPILKKVLLQFKGQKCSTWSESNSEYFAWHLRERFQR